MKVPRPGGRRAALAAAMCVVAAVVAPVPAQDEPSSERIHSGSGGMLPIDGATALRVDSIVGSLVLRGGRPGELRYEARSLDDRRAPRTLVVERRGAVLWLGREDPTATERLLVEVAIAPQLSVQVVVADSRLQVSGLGGSFDLKAQRVDADVRGGYGPVRIELEDAKLKLETTGSDVEVTGRAIEGEVRGVQGMFGLRVEASRVTADGIGRDAEIEIDETDLVLSRAQGAVRLRAHGGSIDFREVPSGAELELEGAPLKLAGTGGTVRVQTDADVEFRDLAGFLFVESLGGSVRGSGNSGSTTVATAHAAVVLENLKGEAHVSGDGLDVRVKGAKAGITVNAVSSQIDIQDAEGPVIVSNEFGDVTVARAAAGVRVTSRDGRVSVTEARGLVELRADGDEVVVEWAEVSTAGDQLVENATGPIVARLPVRAVCRVEAESRFGTVVSTLGAVRQTGERTAAGNVNGGSQPVVRLRAGGDVDLGVGAAEAR